MPEPLVPAFAGTRGVTLPSAREPELVESSEVLLSRLDEALACQLRTILRTRRRALGPAACS